MAELVNKQVSRQEYLQRYTSSGHSKKKVKKKSKVAIRKPAGLKIIDNDIDMKSIDVKDDIEDECGEEAPAVAEVIDERPREVQLQEQYNSSSWKRVGDDSEGLSPVGKSNDSERVSGREPISENALSKTVRHDSDSDSSLPNGSALDPGEGILKGTKTVDSDGDLSPLRVHRSTDRTLHDSDSDLSPERKDPNVSESGKTNSKKHSGPENDILHPYSRKNKEMGSKPRAVPRRQDSDSDLSPPRTHKRKEISSKSRVIPRRQDSDSDLSPPRIHKSKEISSKLHIQSKKQGSDSDLSPPRNRKEMTSKHHTVFKNQNSDSNASHERVGCDTKNHSLSHKSNKERTSRHIRATSEDEFSPPRKIKKHTGSPNHHAESSKRPLCKDSESGISVSEQSFSRDKKNRPTTTLTGLQAGLQDAATMREETEMLKRREAKHIMELPDELSGRNAETVYRDRATGKKRDLKEEMRKKQEEDKKLSAIQEKYSNWGKGLKQKEEQRSKFEDDAYEMTKPLARYKNDEDLDRVLREEIHEGDPMFEYMQKKKQKQQSAPLYPKYSGPPSAPNRFNIQPGYRWDGVDRSNGFEKRYFEKLNATKSKETESHLWSVQDM